MNEWISVKDKLPPNIGNVFCFCLGSKAFQKPFIACYSESGKKWIHGIHAKIPVTHWMPMPEPPE